MPEEVENSRLSPSDPDWHLQYELVFMRFQYELDQLKELEAFEDAEDLGDYVECLTTLLSFRPRSRWDLVAEAGVYHEEWVNLQKGATEG
jgi:hypothetical protein